MAKVLSFTIHKFIKKNNLNLTLFGGEGESSISLGGNAPIRFFRMLEAGDAHGEGKCPGNAGVGTQVE